MPWYLQNIKAPLNGDDAAIRKYAQEMEALRKKVRSSSSLHVDKLQVASRLEARHALIQPFNPMEYLHGRVRTSRKPCIRCAAPQLPHSMRNHTIFK